MSEKPETPPHFYYDPQKVWEMSFHPRLKPLVADSRPACVWDETGQNLLWLNGACAAFLYGPSLGRGEKASDVSQNEPQNRAFAWTSPLTQRRLSHIAHFGHKDRHIQMPLEFIWSLPGGQETSIYLKCALERIDIQKEISTEEGQIPSSTLVILQQPPPFLFPIHSLEAFCACLREDAEAALFVVTPEHALVPQAGVPSFLAENSPDGKHLRALFTTGTEKENGQKSATPPEKTVIGWGKMAYYVQLLESAFGDRNWGILKVYYAEDRHELKPVLCENDDAPQADVQSLTIKSEKHPSASLSKSKEDAFLQIAKTLGAQEGRSQTMLCPPEERLCRQKERYEEASSSEPQAHLLDALPIGVAIVEARDILYANPALLKALGYHSHADLEDSGGFEALFLNEQELSPEQIERHRAEQIIYARHKEGHACAVRAYMSVVPWQKRHHLILSLVSEDKPKIERIASPAPENSMEKSQVLSLFPIALTQNMTPAQMPACAAQGSVVAEKAKMSPASSGNQIKNICDVQDLRQWHDTKREKISPSGQACSARDPVNCRQEALPETMTSYLNHRFLPILKQMISLTESQEAGEGSAMRLQKIKERCHGLERFLTTDLPFLIPLFSGESERESWKKEWVSLKSMLMDALKYAQTLAVQRPVFIRYTLPQEMPKILVDQKMLDYLLRRLCECLFFEVFPGIHPYQFILTVSQGGEHNDIQGIHISFQMSPAPHSGHSRMPLEKQGCSLERVPLPRKFLFPALSRFMEAHEGRVHIGQDEDSCICLTLSFPKSHENDE